MNIPYSTIEPFGFIGMPMLCRVLSKSDVTNVVFKERMHIERCGVYLSNTSIIAIMTHAVARLGVSDIQCSLWRYGERTRIFQLFCTIPQHRISVAFSIEHQK